MLIQRPPHFHPQGRERWEGGKEAGAVSQAELSGKVLREASASSRKAVWLGEVGRTERSREAGWAKWRRALQAVCSVWAPFQVHWRAAGGLKQGLCEPMRRTHQDRGLVRQPLLKAGER